MTATLRKRPAADSAAIIEEKPSSSSHHSHSHGHSHGADEAGALLAALQGSTDRGSRITLIGLAANVGLTGVKGVAGWVLGSAALLADAAHSGSDLLSDIVTLTTFRMSRKPVSRSHPWGYGKYESLGSLVVSFLLVATALGIGFHSYHLLLEILATLPAINVSFLNKLSSLPNGHAHGRVEDEESGVDARAMLFAAASVAVKEYLYRITYKVATEEHSNVLLANALHHRSDAFGSLVALGAIVGAWLGYAVFDPLGGLLVAGMILKNGAEVGITALKELLDQETDAELPSKVHDILLSLRDPTYPSLAPYAGALIAAKFPPTPLPPRTASSEGLPLISIPSIRIFSSGPSFLIDLQLVLPSTLSLTQAFKVEEQVRDTLIEKLGGAGRVREVIVRLRPEA